MRSTPAWRAAVSALWTGGVVDAWSEKEHSLDPLEGACERSRQRHFLGSEVLNAGLGRAGWRL